MNKIYNGKQIDSIKNNIFLSRCNTSEVLVKLGLRKNILKETAEKSEILSKREVSNKPSNVFLSRYDTKTALTVLHKNKN